MKAGVVVLLGRPNVGKSTLLNAILKEPLSIVSPKAQTTRDQIRGILNDDEKGQMVFVDTPGVHRAKEGGVNAFMMQEVRRALEGPDVVLYLIDPFSKPEVEAPLIELLLKEPQNVFLVQTKLDMSMKAKDTEKTAWVDGFLADAAQKIEEKGGKILATLKISAEEKFGVLDLIERLWNALPEGQKLYEDSESFTDRSLRFLAGETIRKQLFFELGDELPYSCGVGIEEFKEGEMNRISAMIYVERESQKGMVIGKGGAKIKSIGIRARKEIEKLVQGKVHLELRVKVLEGWTSDPRKMKELGYELQRKKASR